ncbi:MAG: SufE family protein [Phycisphaerales bacterium]
MALTAKLNDIIEAFRMLDREMRLEMLLDYSKRLPKLPERFRAERDAGLHRVPECMTPVFLWVEPDDGRVRLFVDVAEEAPTVKGFLSILVDAYDDATPDDIAELPEDLLQRLGLSEVIRMNRAIGLSSIIQRIKREAAESIRANGHENGSG